MSVVVQLSDLHLLGDPDEQSAIFEALLSALRKTTERFRARPDLLVLTGDVFDSVGLEPDRAVAAFRALHRQVLEALGGPVPTIVVPGNHDRRRMGLLGPHRQDLFDHLAGAVGAETFVHGTETPFLASVVPADFHRQPFWIIAYDSTFLPRGWVSAGGIIREEDLLHAASKIDGRRPEWPVLFLLHHHLVPTPLTDVGHIEAEDSNALLQWGVRHLLPTLIANADREELTMTALGAGTALSTLHSLGRAVLVLHGHKHYATARLLRGMRAAQGDVLLVSAGSCGCAQPWHFAGDVDVARLWPSFNHIVLDEARTVVTTVAFGWKGTSAGQVVFRPMVNAQREGSHWRLLPLPPVLEEDEGPGLLRNAAVHRLTPSARFDGHRWDVHVTRHVRSKHGSRPHRYVETVTGPTDAELRVGRDRRRRELPERLELDLVGPTELEIHGQLPRTLTEAERLERHRASPFVSVSLMNRYRADDARLEVEGLGAAGDEAFASVTDLGTGLERPARIERDPDGDRVRLSLPHCPPRSLLRIYWPLRRAP